MFKVLLVDDERIIREGISNIIEWDKHGLQLIGAAKNAFEAYEMICSNPPHIVITDIKMPVMDGLELIEKSNEQFPDIMFIVLSGYGEFDFASRAMRYGVKHYLLKPCSEDKIIEALNEVKNELIQRKKMENSIPLNELEKYIGKIIESQNLYTPEQIHDLLKETGCRLSKVNDEKIINNYSKVVKAMIHLVEDNLENEELSLKWIAQKKIFMNVRYLSKLFKKETGKNFSEYLITARIEKAKQLIEEGEEDRIYEIAQKVGFGNSPQYFSVVFKKHTGFSPSDYKKNSPI
jgi:YesN/AraC family two-component response regulator